MTHIIRFPVDRDRLTNVVTAALDELERRLPADTVLNRELRQAATTLIAEYLREVEGAMSLSMPMPTGFSEDDARALEKAIRDAMLLVIVRSALPLLWEQARGAIR